MLSQPWAKLLFFPALWMLECCCIIWNVPLIGQENLIIYLYVYLFISICEKMDFKDRYINCFFFHPLTAALISDKCTKQHLSFFLFRKWPLLSWNFLTFVVDFKERSHGRPGSLACQISTMPPAFQSNGSLSFKHNQMKPSQSYLATTGIDRVYQMEGMHGSPCVFNNVFKKKYIYSIT